MSAYVWLCLCAYVCIDLLPRHDCVTGVGAQAGFYCPPGTSTADEFPCGSVVSVPAPTALPRCRDAPSVCDMTRVSPSPCTARLVVALPRLWMWVTTPRLLSTQPHSGRGNSCVTSGTTVLGDPWQLAHLECTAAVLPGCTVDASGAHTTPAVLACLLPCAGLEARQA